MFQKALTDLTRILDDVGFGGLPKLAPLSAAGSKVWRCKLHPGLKAPGFKTST